MQYKSTERHAFTGVRARLGQHGGLYKFAVLPSVGHSNLFAYIVLLSWSCGTCDIAGYGVAVWSLVEFLFMCQGCTFLNYLLLGCVVSVQTASPITISVIQA